MKAQHDEESTGPMTYYECKCKKQNVAKKLKWHSDDLGYKESPVVQKIF